jgi:uncharacterized membrane protein
MKRAYVAGPRARRPHGVALLAPRVLACLALLGLAAYPFLDGEPLRLLTISTLVMFFAASVSHALAYHGLGWAVGLVVITAGGGLAVEAVGLSTGFPFGELTFADTLGPRLFGVPVVLALAWTAMAYPAFAIARHLVGTRFLAGVPVVGGVALAAWDLFFDPAMVADGHWTWTTPTPAIPGVAGVPVSAYVGWLLVAVVMMTVLTLALPDEHAPVGVPLVLYVGTWLVSVVAALLLDAPAVALVGGLGMALVGLPALWSAWNSRP